MADAQSRYGIMEELSQKKRNAMQRKAQLEAGFEQQKMRQEDLVRQLQTQLDNENAYYKQNHDVWVAKRQADIARLRRELEQNVANIQFEIDSKNSTYEFNHEQAVTQISADLKAHDLNFTRAKVKFDLDVKAIDAEIAELEKATNDLKEMSKEQTSS